MKRKSSRLFDPAAFLSIAGEGRALQKYRKNQMLFAQNDPAISVYFVLKGRVKITVVSGLGKEAVVAIVDKDEFCGESGLSGQLRRVATARALTDCDVVKIDKDAFVRMLEDEPAFSSFFLGCILKRTIRVEEDLVDQLFNSSEKRLARALLMLANYGKDAVPEPIIAKISQVTLAEMIGTTRSRVSFFMNKFRKAGFISYKGSVQIHSSLLNVLLNERVPHIRADIQQPGGT